MATFVDEALLEIRAGRGGDGCASFRREKFAPRGGPDGGDGGRGGDVVIVADTGLSTLVEPRLRKAIAAEDGVQGSGSNRHGRSGRDTEIRLPVGTVIHDLDAREQGAPLVDLTRPGQRITLARGGRGGRGNARFATATRQAPDRAEQGRPGLRLRLRLSLKLLADIGLVGLPNAGKSTLLRRLSAARPRVGAYPFTTLTPSLGVVEVGEERFVAADIPGLIEGASDGAGLGDRFLRHIERTRVLVHLLDAGGALLEERDILHDYTTVRRELEAYSADLAARPEIVVLNKVDLVSDRDALGVVHRALGPERSVFAISAASGEGVGPLRNAMLEQLRAVRAAEQARNESGSDPATHEGEGAAR